MSDKDMILAKWMINEVNYHFLICIRYFSFDHLPYLYCIIKMSCHLMDSNRTDEYECDFRFRHVTNCSDNSHLSLKTSNN